MAISFRPAIRLCLTETKTVSKETTTTQALHVVIALPSLPLWRGRGMAFQRTPLRKLCIMAL
eukprot:96658-Pyramimonas_sp.AAC.1